MVPPLSPRPPRLDAAGHRFRVGQLVRMKSFLTTLSTSSEVFRITGAMPARGGSLQYRIRNDEERHDRMATEDSLEAIDEQPTTANENLEG